MVDRSENMRRLAEMADGAEPQTRTRIVRAIENEMDKELSEKLGLLPSPPQTEAGEK